MGSSNSICIVIDNADNFFVHQRVILRCVNFSYKSRIADSTFILIVSLLYSLIFGVINIDLLNLISINPSWSMLWIKAKNCLESFFFGFCLSCQETVLFFRLLFSFWRLSIENGENANTTNGSVYVSYFCVGLSSERVILI